MSDTTNEIDLADASDDDLKAMGLPARFTLEELQASLTEEEVKALSEGEDPLVSMPDDDAGDGAGEDDPDDEGGEAAAAEGDDDAGAAEDAPEVEAKPDPVLAPVDVSEHQQVLDSFNDDRKALRDKYADGDLSDEEFDAQLDALTEAKANAAIAIKDAERTNADQMTAYRDAWYSKSAAVMQANPALTSKERDEKLGGSVIELFGQACRHVTGNPQFAHLTMDQKLAQAQQITRDVFKARTGNDLGGGAAPAPKATKKAATPKDLVEKQGKRPDPVQTLGNVTSASEVEVENSAWAAIDNAKGLDSEALFSRMSKAEQDAYLAGTL